MKFIMSLLAITALTFVTSACAQEESPSATPAENPSTTIEEKPSTTIEEPKAQKKEEPVAQKKEAPTAQKKEAVATTAAPASGKKMSPDAALRDMENKWEGAYAKHDFATVETMVADDFVDRKSTRLNSSHL